MNKRSRIELLVELRRLNRRLAALDAYPLITNDETGGYQTDQLADLVRLTRDRLALVAELIREQQHLDFETRRPR